MKDHIALNPNVHMHAPGMEFANRALDIVSAKSGGQGLIAVCQSPTTVLGTARFLTACATNKAGNACAKKGSKDSIAALLSPKTAHQVQMAKCALEMAIVPFPLEFVRVRLGTQVRTVPKGVVRHVTVVVLVMKTLAYVLVLMASKASLAA